MAGTMASMQIVGRLVRDAELKYTPGGQAVMHFCTVTDRRTKVNEEWVDTPSFWECALWGKRAESLNQYMLKGTMIALSGAPYIDTWEKDGAKIHKAKIDVKEISLLGGKHSDNPPEDTPKTAPIFNDPDRWVESDPRGKGKKIAPAPDNSDLFPDDIPF